MIIPRSGENSYNFATLIMNCGLQCATVLACEQLAARVHYSVFLQVVIYIAYKQQVLHWAHSMGP